MDQLPRLGKRELICLLLFTCNYVVSVWRGFLFLWVLGMGYVILLWHSLSLPYNYFGSDETDIECQKCSKIVNENIACSGCKLRYCLKCAKINVALYKCIQAGDMDQFMWSFTSCRATFPSLENITSTLNDLKKSNENRFDYL